MCVCVRVRACLCEWLWTYVLACVVLYRESSLHAYVCLCTCPHVRTFGVEAHVKVCALNILRCVPCARRSSQRACTCIQKSVLGVALHTLSCCTVHAHLRQCAMACLCECPRVHARMLAMQHSQRMHKADGTPNDEHPAQDGVQRAVWKRCLGRALMRQLAGHRSWQLGS